MTLKRNILSASCQTGLLVAFNSQATAVGSQTGLSTRNSAYSIMLGGDIEWGEVWYSHPPGTGNTLTVDGQPVPTGSRSFYDPKAC